MLDPDNWWVLTFCPVLGMCIPFAFSTLRSCSKNTALRLKCGVEINWTGYELKDPKVPCVCYWIQLRSLYKNFKIRRERIEIYLSCSHTKQASWETGVFCFFLWSPLPIFYGGQFQMTPGEFLRQLGSRTRSLKLILLYLGHVILMVFSKFIIYFILFFQIKGKMTVFYLYIHLRLLSFSLLRISSCRKDETFLVS